MCLLLCGTARAQNYVPIVSGVATVDASQGTNAQTSSFLIILTANVTSLEIIKPKAGQQITIILQQDSTGGRTVSCAADVLELRNRDKHRQCGHFAGFCLQHQHE